MACKVSGLSHQFGAQKILDNIAFQINNGEKVGLVGRNGCGKSTLLKLMSGQIEVEEGAVQLSGGDRVRYLSQMLELDATRTAREELLSTFTELQEMEKQMREMEEKLGGDSKPGVMRRYEELTHRFEVAGGYDYHRRVEDILQGLGLTSIAEQTVGTLSGGQKTRLSLGKVLAEQAELLLLDEPSNYLDIASTQWLEKYLREYSGAVLIVSHDRFLLNNIVTRVLELEWNKIEEFPGNYDYYKQEKQFRAELKEKAFRLQSAEREKLEEFVRKYMAGQKTKQAQTRRRWLEKMEILENVRTEKTIHLRGTPEKRLGTKALDVKGLAKAFGENALFRGVDLSMTGGEKVAIVGPNGCGKTTFFRILAGDVQADSGNIEFGASAQAGFYYQEHENLNVRNTVIEELWAVKPEASENSMRSYLGTFGFSDDNVFKRVAHLSGGERSRVLLAKLLLEKHNFLLLDEPTNHLDIPTIEALEDYLIDFPGAALFISHDRAFIDAVAQKVVVFEENGVQEYLGNYSDYMRKRSEAESDNAPKDKGRSQEKAERLSKLLDDRREKNRKDIDRRKREKRLKEIEPEIHSAEAEKARLEQELLAASQDYRRAHALAADHAKVLARIDALYQEWEKLESQNELT